MMSLFDLATFEKNIAKDAVDVGAGIASFAMTGGAARDEQKLLDKQERMAEAEFYQQGLQRAKRIREVMSESTAEEAARGVSVASPSFKSVQRSSFEKFQEDQDVAALNLSFKKDQIEAQKKIVRDREKSAKLKIITNVLGDIV
jgi:hypothetical protein